MAYGLFVDRKMAESSFCDLRDSLLAEHPECDINFGFIRKDVFGFMYPSDDGRYHVFVDDTDLFPSGRKWEASSRVTDGVLYARCAETMIHEFVHVDQMIHASDPCMRLLNVIAKYNRDLSNDRYDYDFSELDAHRQALKRLYPHLCDSFGNNMGRQIFDQYVRSHVIYGRGCHHMVLDKAYHKPDDIFEAFDRACEDIRHKPYWYRFWSQYDAGANSNDMVLRVLSDVKWKGAERFIQNSSGLEQSCRCIVALCAQEDPAVLDGLEDMGISVESEFPDTFLDMVRSRSMNEYE